MTKLIFATLNQLQQWIVSQDLWFYRHHYYPPHGFHFSQWQWQCNRSSVRSFLLFCDPGEADYLEKKNWDLNLSIWLLVGWWQTWMWAYGEVQHTSPKRSLLFHWKLLKKNSLQGQQLNKLIKRMHGWMNHSWWNWWIFISC